MKNSKPCICNGLQNTSIREIAKRTQMIHGIARKTGHGRARPPGAPGHCFGQPSGSPLLTWSGPSERTDPFFTKRTQMQNIKPCICNGLQNMRVREIAKRTQMIPSNTPSLHNSITPISRYPNTPMPPPPLPPLTASTPMRFSSLYRKAWPNAYSKP